MPLNSIMIIDIPTSDEFSQQATDLFNLAWNLVLSLLDEHAQIRSVVTTKDKEFEQLYWISSQRTLTTSISLVQQGVEFFLKAKITQISPYLLIADPPRDWPRGCHQQDTPFSDFKTIDAQDLVRVHDTFSPTKLPEEFNGWFNSMRRIRNTILHTVDRNLLINYSDVIIALLQAHEYLAGSQKWIRARDEYLRTSPSYIVDSVAPDLRYTSEGYQRGQLSREIFQIISLLQPSLVRKYFNFSKKQRRYICPNCIKLMERQDFFDVDLDSMNYSLLTAQLRPNKPTSKEIYCILCEKTHAVLREDCNEDYCKGNVIDSNSGCCLTCYSPCY